MPIKIFTGTPEVRERLVNEFIDKMQLLTPEDEMFDYTVASNIVAAIVARQREPLHPTANWSVLQHHRKLLRNFYYPISEQVSSD